MAVYSTAALQYRDKGWQGVLPLPPGRKYPPPDGYTGWKGGWPSTADIYEWIEHTPESNLGLRLPPTVVGIDVDAYGGKTGSGTFDHATQLWGELPPTVRSTARTDGVSGIRLYRVPEGTVLQNKIEFHELGLGNIEVIQYHHRYCTSWPSTHPVVKLPYLWLDHNGELTDIPEPDQLPDLPQSWIDGLASYGRGPTDEAADVQAVLGTLVDGPMSPSVVEVLNRVAKEIGTTGSRFELCRDTVAKLLRMNERAQRGIEPHTGIRTAQLILRSIYLNSIAGETGRDPSEYDRMWTNRHIHDLIASSPTLTGAEENADLAQMGGIDPATVPGPLTEEQQQEFWESRPVLSVIRQFAYARMCSPWAVLGVVLCRVLCTIPPHVTLPPIVGSRGSLNAFVALVGQPSAGKDAAGDVGADVYPGPSLERDAVYVATLGSAEGIAHQYKHRGTSGEDRGKIVEDRNSVLFFVPEIDTLVGLAARNGSVLLSTLRSAYTGSDISFGYADPNKRLRMDKHTYRLCMVLGVQPEKAGAIIDDSGGGLPQRILWMPAEDPGITAEVPEEPFPVECMPGRNWAGSMSSREVTVPDEAVRLVRETRAARGRGEHTDMDGHALFTRLKVSVALAALDHRTEVSSSDWDLSGMIMAKSDETRQKVVEALRRMSADRNEEVGRALGHQQLAAEKVAERARLGRTMKGIQRYLERHGPTKTAALRRGATSGAGRALFQDALDSLIEHGLVVETDAGYALAGA